MEAQLEQQRVMMASIERALANFKKIGRANQTAAIARTRLALLQTWFSQCQQNHGNLVAIATPEVRAKEAYFTEQQFLICEERFFEASDYMTERCQQLSQPASGQPGIDAGCTQTSFSGPRSVSSLPKISLPQFNGEFLKWETFRDQFRSVVIDNTDLSDVTKMHYLLSCLKGEANDSVKALPITEANFKVAWKILSSRYNNERRLVHEHISALNSLPNVTSESAAELIALRDKASMAIQALRNLGRAIDHWDDVLVFFVAQRLDKDTRKAWELHLGDTTEYSPYATLDSFLAARIRALETIPSVASRKSNGKSVVQSHTANTARCPVCQQNHVLSSCSDFKGKSIAQRRELVNKLRRCYNCLSDKHVRKDCQSKGSCRTCQKQHHTLLHEEANASAPQASIPSTSEVKTAESPPVTSHLLSQSSAVKSGILLATAWIRVSSPDGRYSTFRALLDQGSAITLVTERLAQRLRLRKRHVSVAISGIGGAALSAQHAVNISVASRDGEGPSYSTAALVLKSLTTYVPPKASHIKTLDYLHGLELADRSPSSSERIDIIIGADLYGMVLRSGMRRRAPKEPVAQSTIFGWILSGVISTDSPPPSLIVTANHCCSSAELIDQLRHFWEIEEVPALKPLSEEDQRWVEHFQTTHRRDSSGRYIIRLPFKSGPPIDIGESRSAALRMFNRTENRLKSNPALAAEYHAFMRDYLRLGHMTLASSVESSSAQAVFIPHHAVIKEGSSTTRLRVVFNASHKTSNGLSLNDHLMVGPNKPRNIVGIIVRWRQYPYVCTADIAKMYRQIRVDPRDVLYQCILWRFPEDKEVREYCLLTVTYGTASASGDAIGVLEQLARDAGTKFPLAVPVLENDIYVDDCIFGADDRLLLKQTRDQLNELLGTAGFKLRKWASNCPTLVADLDPSDHGLASDKLFEEDENLKVLGLSWNPESDSFRFITSLPPDATPTKRTILSAIARMYDPLGWVAPIVITAKILMQKLWLHGCAWDDDLPADLRDQWESYRRALPLLQEIRVPRWVGRGPETLECELHGFSDASTHAYGAAVYLRVRNCDGTMRSSLVMAKSKVAPLKPLSIPRLELVAALLLAKCMAFLRDALSLSATPQHCWTDSTVTLDWIRAHPSRWPTFVANRVSEIQTRLPNAVWHHVPTSSNPADVASRGRSAAGFDEYSLWWNGPDWLLLSPEQWPSPKMAPSPDSSLEERLSASHHVTVSADWDLAQRYSSWPKLLRVTAYLKRFISRAKPSAEADWASDSAPTSSALSACEIQWSRLYWFRAIQSKLFPDEQHRLLNKLPISRRSTIASLNPFMDEHGLIRAGGRLRQSDLPERTKNPIIIASHPLVKLLIRQTHLQALHAGPALTLQLLRENYWLLRARQAVRSVLHSCITCARERAETATELMADLPQFRVRPSIRAFVHCGLDYAGPLLVRYAPGRGNKSHKAYIALFVCMATRAIHLELVSDCSTPAFLAAFSRFCARRGMPSCMYSDNATNFRGAQRELALAWQAATTDSSLITKLAEDGITWHFIPPSAPHFGGLWEAGVRSLKYHLKRVVGSHTLTTEEMSTLLCRIEACLNSRPLAPSSDNIEDYSALTPGHFLIGSALNAIPEPTLLDEKETRLTRWQLISQLRDRLWKAWVHDYLHSLQQRPKWRVVQALARVGRIVLLRNPLAPPSQWELGRIIKCHPGPDGLCRVATVRTARSEYTRPIAKLCFLPVDINEQCDAPSSEPDASGGDDHTD